MIEAMEMHETEGHGLPVRLHHNAYVCRDQARTRHFYEDVLELPLVATWIEKKEFPEFPGRELSYVHTFYGIEDGGALAFFQFADADAAEEYRARQQARFVHIALAVSPEVQTRLLSNLVKGGFPHRIVDHGYCQSIYVNDPDGLLVEFTVDPENAEEIDAWQRATAHETLDRWLSGDYTINNDIRGHG
ncbi:MAG: VOC family protein [Pseudomonadota bacterium]